MINNEAMNRLADELSRRLADVKQVALPSAALKNLVRESLSRLEVVSQADYERLLQIHQRTRLRVDELAKRVEQLEQKK